MKQISERPYLTARLATNLTVLAVLSPAAGVMVEIILAWRFGASHTVDAFRIAALLLVFGTQLSFGHVLPHVIVPLFSEYRAGNRDYEGWRLAFSLAGLLGCASLAFVSWVWLNPEALVGMLGPGLTGAGRSDALILVRFFSIALVLMVWSGIMDGVLFSFRILWLPLASQLLTNLSIIVAVFAVGREWGIWALAVGVLLGAVVTFALHVYFLGRIAAASGIRIRRCLKWGPWNGVLKAVRLSVPLIVMIVMSQWGLVVINRVLSEMPAGTVAQFGYAAKLQMIVAVMPLSLATVIFPSFADVYARGDHLELSRMVMKSIRMTLLLTMPLAALVFVLREPIVLLILQWGAMDSEAADAISTMFGILTVSTPAFALGTLLNKVSFSMADTKSPAVVQLISALLITIVVPYAAMAAGFVGAAWAFSAIMWVKPLGLLVIQSRQRRAVQVSSVASYFGFMGLLASSIVVTSLGLREAFDVFVELNKLMALVELTAVTCVSAFLCYQLAKVLKIREAAELLEYVRWRCSR